VALLRSHGQETIRLLQNFDESMFKKTHAHELTEEDERLEKLDRKMTEWYQALPAVNEA
jgi:hypothetical protein